MQSIQGLVPNIKVAVIGGAGFIGSKIVRELLNLADITEVRVIDNFSTGKISNLPDASKYPQLNVMETIDIRDSRALKKALKGTDVAYHLAAVWLRPCLEEPDTGFEVNVRGTFNVLRAALDCGVKKLIFSSSASVFGGELEELLKEDMKRAPSDLYSVSKAFGEDYCRTIARESRGKLDTVVLRYMNVYGPGQPWLGEYSSVIQRMAKKASEGESIEIFGDGSNQYDFIHVEDVVNANLLCLNSGIESNVFHVGTGEGKSLVEVAEKIRHFFKNKIVTIDFKEADLTAKKMRISSVDKSKEVLGFEANNVFDESISGYLRVIDLG